MTKYTITIWNTVTYRHDMEVEAEDEAAAEQMAWRTYENADCAADWSCDNSDVEMDIEEKSV